MKNKKYWSIDENGLSLDCIIVPEGTEFISSNCWEFEKETEITDKNGRVLCADYIPLKAEFTQIEIPTSVTEIEPRAFYCHAGLKKISCLYNVVSIGKEAFWGCNELLCVVAPKINPLEITDAETKIKLVAGFIKNSDLYSEELSKIYAKQAQRIKNKLLILAEKHNDAQIYQFFNQDNNLSISKSNNKDAVIYLEKAILDGDIASFSESISAYGPFEFTARALGFACRKGSLEMVKSLVNCGASFDCGNQRIKSKYGITFKPTNREYIAQFFLLPIISNLWDKYVFGYIEKFYRKEKVKTVYSDITKSDIDLSPIPKNMELGLPEKRSECIAYLCDAGLLSHEQLNIMLYYAILEDDSVIVDILKREGAKITVPWLIANAEHGDYISETKRFYYAISKKKSASVIKIMREFNENIQPEKLHLTDSLWIYSNASEDAEIAEELLCNADLSSINKTKLVKWLVKTGVKANSLALLLEYGFVTEKTCSELIDIVSKSADTELLSVLLDYHNKTFRSEVNFTKQRKSNDLELISSSESVASLKTSWGFKKKLDGNLIITSYKGTETEIVVPERIGKNIVTEIGDWAFGFSFFSKEGKRAKNRETRENITKITIPNTVQILGNYVFAGCETLKEIVLPDSITSMGKGVFNLCKNLEQIQLPLNLTGKIGTGTFKCCTNLKTLIIPNGINTIEFDSFECCYLKELHLHAGIQSMYFCGIEKEITTIYAPAGSYAEQYAKENNIPFVAEG